MDLEQTKNRTVRAACPHDCPDTCSMLVQLEDGVVRSVKGDPDHPFTRGNLCVKVKNYEQRVYSPDRILYPMKRTGAKGSGRYEQISWDEALKEISTRYKQIIETDGSEAILPYSYLGQQGLLNGLSVGDAFFNKLGATISERTFCDAGAISAYIMTVGPTVGLDPESISHSNYIIIWACNMLSNNLHQWHFVKEARKRGAKVVVIDPVRTQTAQQADWYIPIKPGTDVALALGMMHVIIKEDLLDHDYIDQYTVGFTQLKARVEEYSPENVAKITGIPQSDIIQLAREYAGNNPAAIRIGVGIERNSSGGQAVRAITSLPALTGAWRYPGGGTLQMTMYSFPTNGKIGSQPQFIKPGTRVINQWRLGAALAGELEGPPVKALFVYNSNPAVVIPEQEKVLKGLAREDLFTVVSEQFMTDTARYADIILPATTQLEQYDLMFSWGQHYITLNQPAIAPLGEAVSNTELFRRLAKIMRFDDHFFNMTDEELAQALIDWDSPVMEGITIGSLIKTGYARLNLPKPEEYAPHAKGNFPTPSGKVELFSSIATRGNLILPAFRQGYTEMTTNEKVDPLPRYYESVEADLIEQYPLNLLSPKSHAFLNSSYGNFSRNLNAAGEPFAIIHPDDAKKRTIGDNERIKIYNQRGAIEVRAVIKDTVLPGVIVVPMGYWPSRSNGATVNAITTTQFADIGHAPTFSDTQVEVISLKQ